MGLFGRIGRMLTGKANDALDSAEDAGSVGRQMIRDLDEKLDQANSAFAVVQGQLEMLNDDIEHTQGQIATWSNAVIKADEKGDQGLVAECVAKLQEHETALAELQQQHADQKADADALQAQIDEALRERNKSANTVRVMDTTSKVASAQTAVADVLTSANANGLSNELGDLQRRVRQESATARAKINAGRRQSGDDLMDRVNAATQESAADVVARLRQQKAA